jgi:predicted amidohydrolase
MRIAIAQIAMRWTTSENVAAIQRAMVIAKSAHAGLSCFPELAISGFHWEIAREAKREIVTPALDAIAESASRLSLSVAVGAAAIPPDNRRFIAQVTEPFFALWCRCSPQPAERTAPSVSR